MSTDPKKENAEPAEKQNPVRSSASDAPTHGAPPDEEFLADLEGTIHEQGEVTDELEGRPEERSSVSTNTKKPRSRVERIVVWSLISILAIVAGLEYWFGSAFTSDYNGILAAIEESNEGDTNVTEAEVKQVLTKYSSYESQSNLKPNNLAASRVDTYTYRGFLKGPGVLYVYYGVPEPGDTTEVIKATTEQAATVPRTSI